jgi:hypothetical protein
MRSVAWAKTNQAATRCAIVALGLVVALAGSMLTPAQAAVQQTAAQEEFVAGIGSAQADLIRPRVQSGSLAVEIITGRANADYFDRSATGRSTMVAVPFLQLAAGGSMICGVESSGLDAGLPDPLVADTAVNGNTEPVETSDDDNAPLFTQSATASPGAASTARVAFAELDVPGLATLGTATAVATTSAEPASGTRRATAETTIGGVDLLGGLVRLEGLHWQLEQTQVGPDDRNDERNVEGAFTLGGITITLPGAVPVTIPLPLGDLLRPAIAQANELLRLLGVELRLPELVHDQQVDAHSLTPLTIAIGGRDWLLGKLLGEVFNTDGFRSIVDLLLGTAFDKQDCNQLGGLMKALGADFNSTYNKVGSLLPLLIAVTGGALGGTGEVQFNIGGVSTSLDNTFHQAPDFGMPGIDLPAPPLPSPATPGPVSTPVAPAHPSTDEVVLGPTTPVSVVCRTVSPAGRPGCWRGAAPLAAALAGGLTIGLFGLDEGIRRRARRQAQATEVVS